jgi:hypothetical protein
MDQTPQYKARAFSTQAGVELLISSDHRNDSKTNGLLSSEVNRTPDERHHQPNPRSARSEGIT